MADTPARQRFWHLATWPTRHAPPALLALIARLLPRPLRVASSPHWVVMRHPFPSYTAHLVVIARRPCRDMLAGPHLEELNDLVTLAGRLAEARNIVAPSLVSNVGAFQSVGQLHFHLVPAEEFRPLTARRLAFGASCLQPTPAEVAALAAEALEISRGSARNASAARLFILDVEAGSHPAVAVELGGARRA